MNELLSKILQPNSIYNMVGQKHLIGDQCLIRKMVETKQVFSCIFFGLPGTGKTTMAKAICSDTNIPFGFFNPTKNKKSDLDLLLKNGLDKNKQFIIIIDEIHRMNKDKQDLLLSYLENNKLIIFGTTTENPYFVINPAIRSRCQIIQLKPLGQIDVFEYLKKIIEQININIDLEALELITNHFLGDLRSTLNFIDIVYKLYKDEHITKDMLIKLLPSSNIIASSYGNEFYDLQSAFHKSLRGSDIDASIYYLARLIKIGDLSSISRRMIAMAYEDIGLANPSLLSRVILAINSAERLGFPEANQILATTVIELCLSPKSNSAYMAISKALIDMDDGLGSLDIPIHLKDTHYKSATKLGYGNYKYPHDYKNNWVKQQYLPKEIINKKYYIPSNNNIELKMNEILKERKNEK